MAINVDLRDFHAPDYSENEKWERMASVFKTLSDATRLKIVHELIVEERRVCDIARDLDMSLPAISYHLKLLRDASVIKSRRDGKNIFYSVDDQLLRDLFRVGSTSGRMDERGA
jgi:ArsR family transcriptional regulator, lead/cadmium/zinc/bismuth-responsive transcriptional repressor